MAILGSRLTQYVYRKQFKKHRNQTISPSRKMFHCYKLGFLINRGFVRNRKSLEVTNGINICVLWITMSGDGKIDWKAWQK